LISRWIEACRPNLLKGAAGPAGRLWRPLTRLGRQAAGQL
jgi:hypothetical protein